MQTLYPLHRFDYEQSQGNQFPELLRPARWEQQKEGRCLFLLGLGLVDWTLLDLYWVVQSHLQCVWKDKQLQTVEGVGLQVESEQCSPEDTETGQKEVHLTIYVAL